MTNHKTNAHYMQIALNLARRGLGNTFPNPAVGCVIVKDGVIVGRGWTAPGGRPHAETQALAQAGTLAKGATAYITLEPCSHNGQTPPCTEALINAGISQAVIATEDPYPAVQGSGMVQLQRAGIKVTPCVEEEEAREVNRGFIKVVTEQLPMVTLKLALTKDGRITRPAGAPSWFTGKEAKTYTHLLRAQHDAIMVGSGTVYADNPSLTCRLPGMAHRSPDRIILSREGNITAEAACQPCTILTAPSIRAALTQLAEKGYTRILSEGGGTIAEALLAEKLVDILVLIQSPHAEGAADAPNIQEMLDRFLPHFTLTEHRPLGEDILHVYESSDTTNT